MHGKVFHSTEGGNHKTGHLMSIIMKSTHYSIMAITKQPNQIFAAAYRNLDSSLQAKKPFGAPLRNLPSTVKAIMKVWNKVILRNAIVSFSRKLGFL